MKVQGKKVEKSSQKKSSPGKKPEGLKSTDFLKKEIRGQRPTRSPYGGRLEKSHREWQICLLLNPVGEPESGL